MNDPLVQGADFDYEQVGFVRYKPLFCNKIYIWEQIILLNDWYHDESVRAHHRFL